MKKVILTDNIISLKDVDEEKLSKFHYIYIGHQNAIDNYLQERCNKKINLTDYKDQYGRNFLENYIDFIGKLSQKYHSFYWWANSISEKNTLLSDLHKNIYSSLLTTNIILKENLPFLLIFTENEKINKIIEIFCKKRKIPLEIFKSHNKRNKHSSIPKILVFIAYFTIHFVKEIYNHMITRAICQREIQKKIYSKNKSYYVIRTWFSKRTINSIKNLKDTYFGVLPEYLVKKKKNVILFGGLLGNDPKLIKKIQLLPNKNFIIIPENYFFKIRDYLSSFFLTVLLKINMKTPIFFSDFDVSPLVLDEINKYHPSKVIKSILYGNFTKRLASTLDIEYFTYTFENHSWEKITLSYLRKVSPKTVIIGYQHAGITKSLLNFYPSRYEKNLLPLPDRIVTVGKHPKRILEKYGCYKEGLIIPGCALRYEYLYKNSVLPRQFSNKVFIPLTASIEESVKIIKFVQEGIKETEYIPRYRCHPIVTFSAIKAKMGNNIKGKYEISSEPSLNSDLKNCGHVIYTTTTVCMEALMLGIPVVHIDFNEPVNGDPLFECDFLRWIVKKPENLKEVLNEIKNLKSEIFLDQQKKARNYLEEYFVKLNDKNLEVFL